MNINIDRFLALTALLAAPLVAAPGCIITGSNDDDNSGTDTNSSSASNTNSGTGMTTAMTSSATEPGTGDGTGSATGDTDPTGVDSTGDVTGNTTGNATNCCEPHGGLGCDDATIQDCVCAEDPVCCDSGWDMVCAQEVNDFGCGVCELPPTVYECYCTADCDGTFIDTPWEVCATGPDEAAVAGQAACEADLEAMMCGTFVCDECGCAAAEAGTITC